MLEDKKRNINFYSVLLKIVLYTFFLSIIVIGILHLPSVQTWITNKVVNQATSSINGIVTIEEAEINVYEGVQLANITVFDADQDTLLTLESARISPRNTIITLLTQKMALNDIIMSGAHMRLIRKVDDQQFNWERFLGAQNQEVTVTKQEKKPLEITYIRLSDFNFDLVDEQNRESVQAQFSSFEVDINLLDLENNRIDISRLYIEDPIVSSWTWDENIKDLSDEEVKEDILNKNNPDESITNEDTSSANIFIRNLSIVNGCFFIDNGGQSEVQVNNIDLSVQDLAYHDLDKWSLILESFSGMTGEDIVPYSSIQRLERRGSDLILEEAAINLNNSRFRFEGNIEDIEGVADVSASKISLDLYPSMIYLQDLFSIIPELENKYGQDQIVKKRMQIEGSVKIYNENYIAENLSIWLNGLHHFDGEISFNKATKIEESILNISADNLYSNIRDLASLSSKFKIPKELVRLETVGFSGSFDGFLNDFVANGVLESPLGKANLDIKFDFSGDDDIAVSYDGFLSLDSFDVRKITLNEDFGYVSAQVNITNGRGPDLASSSADIKAVIDQIEYKDFVYKDAMYAGHLSSRVIDGSFRIVDDQLDFLFEGVVDFSDSISVFDFNVDAKKINFCQLNLTDFPCELGFSADINLKGNSINNLDGVVLIDDAVLQHDTARLNINRIQIESIPGEMANSFSLSSDYGDFDIEGRFNLLKVFQNSLDRLVANVAPHNEVWDYNLKGGEKVIQKYKYNLTLKDATPVFKFLNIDVVQNGYAQISGSQAADANAMEMKASIPFISYKDMSSDSLLVEIVSAEGMANLNTRMFNFKRGSTEFPLFNFVAGLQDSAADWSLEYDYNEYNKATIIGQSVIQNEGYFTSFLDDNVTIDSTRWKILPNRGLGVYPSSIDIEDFTLSDGKRYVSLKDIDSKGLELALNDFELGFMNPIIDYDKTIFSGKIRSVVSVNDIYKNRALEGYVDVADFRVNGDDFGHLSIKAIKGLGDKNLINLDLSITKDTQNLYAIGYVDLDSSYLDVDLTIEDYPMSFFEYIIEDGISETVGTTDITAKLHGKIEDLKLDGEALVKNTGVKVDFLGAYYRLDNAAVSINEKFIDFNDVELKDEMGNTAVITGGLRHNILADIRADLSISSPRFIGLNTTFDDNPLYYGIGVGDLDISFDGPFDAIDIVVAAELQNLSHLYVPLTTIDYVYDESFIIFANSEDIIEENSKESLAELLKDQGVDFEMSLTFTPEAKVSIIYDETTSNILEGQGEGNIQINVKRDGEFTAYGTYNVLSGQYLYTAYGLIAKPFNIQSGGTVTWTGDPLNATLNVTAQYPSLRAPLENLIKEFEARLDPSEMTARREIDLKLILTGQLFNPNIDFDIAFPNLTGSVRTLAENKVRTLKATENGINNQVVGLMVFNNFLPDNNGLAAISSSDVGQTGNNTITQYLTSQLSLFFSEYLSSKLGDDDFISAIDLEIGVAQNTSLLGDDATVLDGLLDVVPDEVQLNMRNHFKNDNFVLNLGGNYVRERQIGTAENYVTGDFSLDWFITEDRKLKLRFYGNYDYDDAFATRRQRYGFGINFRREFGSLSDFEEVLDEMIRQIQEESETLNVTSSEK